MILIEESFDGIVTESAIEGKKAYLKGPMMEAEIKNRNQRIYDLTEMKREIKKVNEAAELGRHILGELDHPCFTDSAEVLTNRGWSKFTSLLDNDSVFSMNPETRKLEESPILERFVHDFKGKMIRLSNRTFGTTITPNHKFLVFHSTTGKHKFITAREIKEAFENNDRSIAKWFIPRKTGGIANDVPVNYTIPGIGDDFNVKARKEYFEPIEVNTTTFMKFLGLYLSEGCTYRKSDGGYEVTISQNEGDTADYIRDVLSEMPFKWTERHVMRDYGDRVVDHVKFTTYDRRLAVYLKVLGTCYDKYIPEDIFKYLNSDTATALLEGYIAGDGRGSPDTPYRFCDMFSVSERLTEDLGRAGVIAGYSMRFYKETCSNDYMFAGRVIEAKNKKPLNLVKILSSNGVYLDSRHMVVEEVDYDDKVYCISANHHNFIVRDGGYTFVTGNSDRLEIKLAHVSHQIEKLWLEGNIVYGKARILDKHPKGQILRALVEEGVQVGVSSRGSGQVNESTGRVNNFSLSTIDAVATPSARSAYPESIMEQLMMNKRGTVITDLSEAVLHDPLAQKYFQIEMKKFIESLYK